MERQSIPVDMRLILNENRSRLYAASGGDTISIDGDVPQPARTRPTDWESAKKCLEKTGGTPFFLRSLETEIAGNVMLPVSALNALRRAALDALLASRGRVVPHALQTVPAWGYAVHQAVEEPALWGRFETAAQIPEDTSRLERIILPAEAVLNEPALAGKYGERLITELPALLFPEEEDTFTARLAKLSEQGVRDVLADNAYGIHLAHRLSLRVHGGFGLNILNSAALAEYQRLGLSSATVSFELSMQKIRRLGGSLPRGILAYGRLPLMRLRACPAKSGCAACDGHPVLTDRRGVPFPLLCHGKAYATLLNSVPLYIADKQISGVDYLTLYFTNEPSGVCGRVISQFAEHASPDFARTNGLYYRSLQ